MTAITVKINDVDEVDQRLDYMTSQLIEKDKWPVLIQVLADTRSKQQNRYYWGWLLKQLATRLEEAGIVITDDKGTEYPYTADLLHEIFKEQFLCRGVIVRGDKERKLCWSTTQLGKTTLDTEDGERPCFKWYVDQIKQFASQYWSVEIPEPPLRHCDYPELMEELR